MTVQIFNDRPGDRKSIVSAGTAPDLVQNQQAARGGIVQNISGLKHLHHKGRLPLVDGILCTNARENPVDNTYLSPICRHKTANLCHEHDQNDLAQKCGFATHIRSGDQADDFTVFKNCVIGNVPIASGQLLHNRVPPCQDVDALFLFQDRPRIFVQCCHFTQ